MSQSYYTAAQIAKVEKIEADMSDEQRTALIEHRGGCSCHLSPPCFSCSEPVTMVEADELGWLEDDEPAPQAEGLPSVDYSSITRSFCR